MEFISNETSKKGTFVESSNFTVVYILKYGGTPKEIFIIAEGVVKLIFFYVKILTCCKFYKITDLPLLLLVIFGGVDVLAMTI